MKLDKKDLLGMIQRRSSVLHTLSNVHYDNPWGPAQIAGNNEVPEIEPVPKIEEMRKASEEILMLLEQLHTEVGP